MSNDVYRGDIPGKPAARGTIGVSKDADSGQTGRLDSGRLQRTTVPQATPDMGSPQPDSQSADDLLRQIYGLTARELIEGITSGRLGGELLKNAKGEVVGIVKDGRKYVFGAPENTGTITPAARPDSVPRDGLPRTPGFAAGIGGNATQPAGGTRHSPAGGPSGRDYPKGSRQP